MSDWLSKPIGALLRAQFPGEWGADSSAPGELARVFRGADFVASGRLERSGGALRSIAPAKLKKLELTPGDILLEKSGGSPDQPVGRVSYFEGANSRAVASNFLQTLRPADEVDSKFLFYLLQHEYARGRVLPFQQQTTGIINFRLKDYLKERVKVPASRDEQRRIADLLSAVDELLAIGNARLVKLASKRAGFVQQQLLPVAYASEEASLGSIAPLVTSGSRGWASYYADEGALFLRIGNLTRLHPNLRFDDVVRVKVPARGEGARTRLVEGDVLISITADLGIVGCVPCGLGEAYVNQHIALARITEPSMNPRWVAHALASPYGASQVARLNDGGAKAGLNLPTIRALKVPKASPEQQRTVAAALDALDAQISAEQASIRKLALQKQGLLRSLLAGSASSRVGAAS